jgi:hypothetical protein
MSQDWAIYIYEESGGEYVFDYYMNRPNQNLETQENSTMQTVTLADGSRGFFTPETKYNKEPFQMYFANTSEELRTTLYSYLRNSYKIKIITHNSEVYIGKITNIQRVYFSGRAEWYDLQVLFTIMEN